MKSSIKVTFLGKTEVLFSLMVSFTQLNTTHGTKNQLSPETSELNGLRKKCMIPVLPVQVDQGVKCGSGNNAHMTWQPNVVTKRLSRCVKKFNLASENFHS